MTIKEETAVRDAAAALQAAIAGAKAVGLVVAWPSRPEDLASIAISSTGKVANLDGAAQVAIGEVGATIPAGGALIAPSAAAALPVDES